MISRNGYAKIPGNMVNFFLCQLPGIRRIKEGYILRILCIEVTQACHKRGDIEGAEQTAEQQSADQKGDDDVVEAEYEEVSDDDK